MTLCEYVSWADVSRVVRDGTTYRRYDIHYPPLDGSRERELELEALAQLAAIADARLVDPASLAWLEVGTDLDGRSWAIEPDFDGFDVVDAWRFAARVRGHDIELVWRDAGAMADADYAVSTIDSAGRWTRRIRKGPWDPASPIDSPSASRHRTVRVRRAPIAARVAARVIVEAGRAVARLHAAGFVHGMLTTKAIALTRDGGVAIRRIATYKCFLRGSMYVGSGSPGRFYADVAPELIRSGVPSDVTPASDVFQLASALYELLAFSPAWMRATSFDSIAALRDETLAPISTIHAEAAPLDAIIAHALARDRRTRPALADFIAAVDACFPAARDDTAELARIVADASRTDPQSSSPRDVPMW